MVNPGYPRVIAARVDSDDTPKDLEMPDNLTGLKVALYCYNPETLAWVRMRQPMLSPLREDDIADERWEYDAGVLKWYGWHKTMNASVDDTGWYISRWDYALGQKIRGRHIRGAWSNKVNLIGDP